MPPVTGNNASFDKVFGSLRAKGARLTRIAVIGSVADTRLDDPIWPQDWNAIAGLPHLKSPSKHPDIRAQDQDLGVWVLPSDATSGHPLSLWWRTLFGDTILREARIDSNLEDQAAVSPRDVEGVEKLCKHLTEYLQIQVHDGRRLFRTEDGVIGLGPPSAQTGDSVCMLYGGDVLYVSRETMMGRWKYVGECYLYGMMDGAALTAGGVETDFRFEAH